MIIIRIQLFVFGAILFGAITFSSAQITFQKTFGGTDLDVVYSIQQTIDGGYIMTGYTFSFGAGNSDVYLIKTNANGDTLWTKTFGGMDNDFGSSVQQTTDGGYIVTGQTQSFGAGLNDVYLIKTNANGDTLWTKTFGGISDDRGLSVQQTIDGGYIITGHVFSIAAGISDAYLIKTDANGDSLWTKAFGGINNEEALSVQQTTDGGYILCGYTLSFGAGFYDVYLIKTDSNGDSLWSKTFGGTGYEIGNSVKQTMDGGYILTGETTSFGAGNIDVYLIRTDPNGNSLWTKTFGGLGIDRGNSVQQINDGGYIITGSTNISVPDSSDVYLIRADTNGVSIWTKTFGGADRDYGETVCQTMDGGYIIGGWTWGFGAGNIDVYLIKTNANGISGCNEGNKSTVVSSPSTIVTSPFTMVTSPPTTITAPTTLVGSGATVNTLCTSVVGINEIVLDNSFIIYPNPSAGKFIISFEETIMKYNIEILNFLGDSIFAENIFNESQKEINLKNMASGIYFVKVYYGEKYYCKKIIIE